MTSRRPVIRRGDGGSFAIGTVSTQDQKQPINRTNGIEVPKGHGQIGTNCTARAKIGRKAAGEPQASEGTGKGARRRRCKRAGSDDTRNGHEQETVNHFRAILIATLSRTAGLAHVATKTLPCLPTGSRPIGPFLRTSYGSYSFGWRQ